MPDTPIFDSVVEWMKTTAPDFELTTAWVLEEEVDGE